MELVPEGVPAEPSVGSVLPAEMTVMPVERLRLHPRNPRRGNVAAIKESLRENNQYTPLTVRRDSFEVLRGNHTLQAARELGWQEIAVYLIDVDEERATRILLADNRTSDLATYDTEELIALLNELGDLGGTGYQQADLDELLDSLPVEIPASDEEAPPRPVDPVTRPGELIVIGEHRLVCGDATDPAVHERLLAGEQASLLVTDPPYGVSYSGKTEAALSIRNDDAAGLPRLLEESFRCADGGLVPGAPLYVFHPAGPQSLVFADAFVGSGWRLRQGLVWLKDQMVLGHGDYHYRHEPILYGFKPGEGRLGRGGAGWYGDSCQTSVFEVPRPRAARLHPTMKPVELLAILVANSSRRNGVVLDPFAGSGSTLLACERLGRRARLIELDPGYCDVIIGRYEQATGHRAERQA